MPPPLVTEFFNLFDKIFRFSINFVFYNLKITIKKRLSYFILSRFKICLYVLYKAF
ncbi:hypothetical protein TPHV1_90063 [Treponema phagedenis]|uniref:Uncharacterized protein n=1 Tax=Treponema phagedenis TaxID=162 RepID=A0A0B7GXN7_TREPH|nr:hypothetical protein TPHV1_90063 [Treponema phagedenis]